VEASFEIVDLEASRADCRRRVARRYAAAEQAGPEQPIDHALKPAERCVLGANVLVEAELTAGSDDPVQLGERRGGLGDGAKDPHGDGGVECSIGRRQGLGSPVDDIDRHLRFTRPLRCDRSRRWVGLDGQDAFDLRRVQLERPSVAAADLDHPPAYAGEQSAAVLARPEIGLALLSPLEVAGEARLFRAVERRLCRHRHSLAVAQRLVTTNVLWPSNAP
jgi:hypothetical protein